MAWVRARLCKLQKGCTRVAATSDKVYQLLAHGWWFPAGTPASSTTKTGRHDIAEILLKVALNTINKSIKLFLLSFVLSVLIWFTTSNSLFDFGIIKLFLSNYSFKGILLSLTSRCRTASIAWFFFTFLSFSDGWIDGLSCSFPIWWMQ